MRGESDHAAEQAIAQQLMPQIQHQHRVDSLQPQSSVSPHEHSIDPVMASGEMGAGSAGESGGDENGAASDTRKGGKRELSTSKRAAQNRAAQRAFRQRKEGHIKQLEAQVKDYASLSESYKAVQAENYQLRDYIISLQSRLIESQGEFPQPPSNIDIPRPSGHSHQHIHAPTAPMASSAVSQLQASAAQAVAGLGPDSQLEGNTYRRGSESGQRSRGGDTTDPANAA